MIQINLQNRNSLTLLQNKLMVTSGEGWGRGSVREFGIVHTDIFKMDNQQGPTV